MASFPGPGRDAGAGEIGAGLGVAVVADVAPAGGLAESDDDDCAIRGAFGAMTKHPIADQTSGAIPTLPGLWIMAVPQPWPNGLALVGASKAPRVSGLSS